MFHLAFSTPNHQQQSVVQATTTLVGTTTPTHHVPKPLDINEASQGWINYHYIQWRNEGEQGRAAAHERR